MQISEKFKNQNLNYLASYLPQEIIQNPEFKSAVFSSLDELAELSIFEVCEARKKGLDLSCDPQDLAERVLRIANGDEFIAGIRFKNLDANFPFVEINSSIEMSSDVMSEICQIVQSEFKNLRPLGLKFKDKPNAHPSFEKWSQTVFGKIEKHQVLDIPLQLVFSFTKSTDWHPQYVAEYQERLAEKIELNGFVRIGELDEFLESATDEALLIANDPGGFCGVVSGIKSPLYGLPAIYMVESYLSKRWIGKKVAPMAHVVFLNEMSKRFSFVWGTIYDRNLSSLKAALRVGRRIIETEYFARF